MKPELKRLILFILFILFHLTISAQINIPRNIGTGRRNGGNNNLDSLRKLDEDGLDSIIYTAKFIRYTYIDLLKNSNQTLPLDTALNGFQKYSPIAQIAKPTMNLGAIGLPYRDMLFNPDKSIGFQPGFHSLEAYLLTQDSVRYYRAKTPYTKLYYINGGETEQILKVTHTQNITQGWNVGANYFRNYSQGFYTNQNANHSNGVIFTWFESKNKRYNLLANALFNTLKAAENGSVVRDSLFTGIQSPANSLVERIKLNGSGANQPKQTWRQKDFLLQQSYYLGRIDSLSAKSKSNEPVLPTQKITHTLNYSNHTYKFFSNEPDTYGIFPYRDTVFVNGKPSYTVNDSTTVKHLKNELNYSFYLRAKDISFIKNELRLTLGIKHDLYQYNQMGYESTLQNLTFMALPGYRFSDKVNIEGNLQQIFQGKNAGDYLYEAKVNFLLSRSAGRIVLGAYAQNKSPEQLFERSNYTFHRWQQSFDRTKINSLNFTYLNPKIKTNIQATYFLLSNYLYLVESSVLLNTVLPRQQQTNISLLQLSLAQKISLGKFHLENYTVLQQSDQQDILRIPVLYTHNSLYFSNRYFKVLNADLGVDISFYSPYTAPSYAINISQFYNGSQIKFANYPLADVWIRASLRKANIFVKYDYANQGLFSRGYYTVNRYPMANALFKFGVSWNFYD